MMEVERVDRGSVIAAHSAPSRSGTAAEDVCIWKALPTSVGVKPIPWQFEVEVLERIEWQLLEVHWRI